MIHVKTLPLFFYPILTQFTSPSGHSCVKDVYTVPKNNYIHVSMNVLLLLIPEVKVNVRITT